MYCPEIIPNAIGHFYFIYFSVLIRDYGFKKRRNSIICIEIHTKDL